MPPISMRLWQRIASALLLITLTAGCSDDTDDSSEDEDAAVAVAAHEVDRRTLSRNLQVSGLVEADDHVRVHARTDGVLQQLELVEGDTVSADDTLARLDMAEQRAELNRAQAVEEEAELNYERVAALYEQDNISTAEYQQARASFQVAQSETELWEARVGFGRIRSPIDGVITERPVEPGEHVETQDQLFTIADMESLQVRFSVSELNMAHLAPGDTLKLDVDALSDESIKGEIKRVFPSADPESRRIPIEVTLPSDSYEQGLRPGFLVRLETEIDRQDDILSVPTLAIGEEGTEDAPPFVFVIRDDRLERREVEPGMVRGQWTQIRSGLEQGDTILATNPRDRREDEAVRIVEWRD